MELQYLNNLTVPLQTPSGGLNYNAAAYIEAIQKQWKPLFELKAYKQFDVDFHEIVINRVERPDREVFQPTGEVLADGTTQLHSVKVKVARLPVPFQQLIVSRATQFLTGGKITNVCRPQNAAEKAMFQTFTDTWIDNKLIFKNSKLAKAMMSQLEVVELWYSDVDAETGEVKMCMNILEPKNGFTFYPVFDALENLIAFGIHWRGADKLDHFDLYTATEKRSHVKINGIWDIDNNEDGTPAIVEHGYGKIPVIYYSQLKPEWHPVQRIIERYEQLISNFADINDYNGSPILFLSGEGISLPAKGTAGKVIESKDGKGDAKYVTWDQAPEAIKLEIDTLEGLIYAMTQTAPIDFENMKGLGQLSGVAFDRILIDSHLKAKEKQSDMYGENIQRRNNFLVTALASIHPELSTADDLNIEPKFDIFRIDDEADNLALIVQANGGKPVISQKTSIRLSGLVPEDAVEEEYTLIKAENDFLGAANQPPFGS